MADSSPGDLRFVTVVCRVCGTRLDERVARTAREVTCPDCFSPCRVPPLSEIPDPPPARKLGDAGTYQLQHPQSDRSPSMDRPRVDRPDPSQPGATVLVKCPTCLTRIDEIPHGLPRMVRCHDCHEPVRIPSREEVEARREREQQRQTYRPPPVEALPVPAAGALPELRTGFIESQAQIRRERDAPPPNWTFFSRVYTLPWHAEMWGRWVGLSLGLTAMTLLGALIVSLTQQAGSPMYLFIAFLGLPMVWITLWTVSYAAACCLVIIEDTANGNDRIVSWGEQNWREWLLKMAFLGAQWLLAVVVGDLTARTLSLAGVPFLPTLVTVTWIAFPVFLLSTLEGNSVFTPLTWPILRSLWTSAWGWALYFLLATGVVFGLEAALWMLQQWLPGPVVALPVRAGYGGSPVHLGETAGSAGLGDCRRITPHTGPSAPSDRRRLTPVIAAGCAAAGGESRVCIFGGVGAGRIASMLRAGRSPVTAISSLPCTAC